MDGASGPPDAPVVGSPVTLAVVVAYGAPDLLAASLAELTAAGCPVVVVDNSGSDRIRELADRPGFDYLDPGGNIGFAAGVNAALARAWDRRSDVLLVNPDALVRPADLAALENFLRTDPRLAAVGPGLVDVHGARQRADWPLPTPGQVWLDALGLGRWFRGERFVTGAVLLLRGSALAEVGPLDERYFLYAEEADWQLRAQRAGWRVGVCPWVTVTHVGAASSSNPLARERRFQRSAAAFAAKWYGPRGARVLRAGAVVAAARRALLGRDRAAALRTLGLLTGHHEAPAEPVAGPRTVVQVVRSDAFAGVERYIVDVAGELVRRGWHVMVIGGDPGRMRRALPAAVEYRSARSVAEVARALWSVRRAAVVHAHMTAAELPAALLKHRLGARLVVTRHFAGARGSTPAGRLGRRVIEPRVDAELAVSAFVAQALGTPALVLPNGVPDVTDEDGVPAGSPSRTVALVQRLEPEKDTGVAIAAWSMSGLPATGWRLVVHGEGSQADVLRALAAGQDSISFGGFTDAPLAVFAGAGIVLATAPAEPFGLSVAEAMSTGAPIAAARGGAHTELLGEHGVYFTAGDAADCARALAGLAADDQRLLRGRRLRERQRLLFSLPAHVDALERVYR